MNHICKKFIHFDEVKRESDDSVEWVKIHAPQEKKKEWMIQLLIWLTFQ